MSPKIYQRAWLKYSRLMTAIEDAKDQLRVCDNTADEGRAVNRHAVRYYKLVDWLNSDIGRAFREASQASTEDDLERLKR